MTLLSFACHGDLGGGGDDDPGSGSDGGAPGTDGGAPPGSDGGMTVADGLETATGCDGPYNPGQVLVYHITTGGNFTGIEMDDYGPGTFACGDEAPMNVGVRPRAAGEGWRVDFNWAVQGQHFRDLKKMAFHTGAGGNPTTEYLGFRFHRLGGAVVQRSALAHVFVDGQDQGILFSPEVIDKRFLESRLGDDTGWLFKQSGSLDDGYRTNEGIPNPYEAQWCIFDNAPCALPADLETWLPEHLAIEQLLRMGAVNNIIGDSDGPIAKSNNFYTYDYATGPRYYFPWDFDSAFQRDLDVFPSGQGATGYSSYHAVLFTHWEDDYDAIITALVAGSLSIESVNAELEQALAVGAPDVSATEIARIRDWYAVRHASVVAQVEAH